MVGGRKEGGRVGGEGGSGDRAGRVMSNGAGRVMSIAANCCLPAFFPCCALARHVSVLLSAPCRTSSTKGGPCRRC